MEQITKQYCHSLPESLHLAMDDLVNRPVKGLLNNLELEEYRSFKHSRRRNEFISARYLIKELARDAGINPNLLEIKKDHLGKPFAVHEGRRWFLSLAHADGKVLCGFSGSMQVGIDLESSQRKVDDRLRSRILNEGEKESMSGEDLIRIWTLKEAMVKLDGRGMRTNLDRIVLSPRHESEFLGRFGNGTLATIVSFEFKGYWVAVAYYN